MKEVCDKLDANPDAVDFSQDNAIQVAATMKKFLRDLPEPLLTFKLFKLFVATQRILFELYFDHL